MIIKCWDGSICWSNVRVVSNSTKFFFLIKIWVRLTISKLSQFHDPCPHRNVQNIQFQEDLSKCSLQIKASWGIVHWKSELERSLRQQHLLHYTDWILKLIFVLFIHLATFQIFYCFKPIKFTVNGMFTLISKKIFIHCSNGTTD